MVTLRPLIESEEFSGWDNPKSNPSDIVLVFEYKHAWRQYHDKHSCPLEINGASLRPAFNFCSSIGIPFRFFLEMCIRLLDKFPAPWELNLRWLREEIALEWAKIKEVQIISEVDVACLIQKMRKAQS